MVKKDQRRRVNDLKSALLYQHNKLIKVKIAVKVKAPTINPFIIKKLIIIKRRASFQISDL